MTLSTNGIETNELGRFPNNVDDVAAQDDGVVKPPTLVTNLTSLQSSLIVEGLEANTEYSFEVVSSNILGRSRSSTEPLEVITQSESALYSFFFCLSIANKKEKNRAISSFPFPHLEKKSNFPSAVKRVEAILSFYHD